MLRRTQALKSVIVFTVTLYVGFLFVQMQHEMNLKHLITEFCGNRDARSLVRASIPSELCSPAECMHGRWVPRSPRITPEDLLREYTSNSSTQWYKCDVLPPPEGVTRTPEEKGKLERERLLDVMNYDWVPYRGRMVPFDAEDMVVQLLRTPGGIIFIGDSISGAHEHTFHTLLEHSSIRFDNQREFPLPWSKDPNLHQKILKPGDPMTLKLQRRAGVPDSRLRYPIFTLIEDHMLLHEPDIRKITQPRKDYFWYHKFKRVENWEDYVRYISTPRVGEEDAVTGDTILLLSAGAHWSRAELAMLPDRPTENQEQRRLAEVYRLMVNMIIERLAPMPRISVFYRSTSPGHPNCGDKPMAYANISDALVGENNDLQQMYDPLETDNDRRVRKRWDWNMFNVHNEIWRGEIERLQQPTTDFGELAFRQAKWRFLDFWEMNIQRPDAHSEPGRDCLHWCKPGIHHVWSFYVYHLMYLQTHFPLSV